jgi:hypothetical protein
MMQAASWQPTGREMAWKWLDNGWIMALRALNHTSANNGKRSNKPNVPFYPGEQAV